jgi:predicted TIM-barrel fold metal-dependent hydrolase
MIVDFHAHAFPDAIAPRAMARLELEHCKAKHDGTVSGLLRSMDRAGIDKAVVCSIATKPEQFAPILRWSRAVASDRLIPFASVHPSDPDAVARIREVKESGLKGIKLHPYYQDFDLGDERLDSFYQAIADSGLVLVSHTGYDMAFPQDQRAAPLKSLRLTSRFPPLRFVATHFGAWQDWDEVERQLIGKPLTLEISLTLEYLSSEVVRRMILAHPFDRVLFGTDSPWGDSLEALQRLRALELDDVLFRKISWENAMRLLA